MKVNTHLLVPPHVSIKTDLYIYLFLIVIIDFIINLPESNKYNTLYIIVDYDLIKVIVLILCIKTINIIRIVRLYHNNIY